jgi:hypothetical protein
MMYDMWVDLRDGGEIKLQDLRAIYGEEAYAYNNDVIF